MEELGKRSGGLSLSEFIGDFVAYSFGAFEGLMGLNPFYESVLGFLMSLEKTREGNVVYLDSRRHDFGRNVISMSI